MNCRKNEAYMIAEGLYLCPECEDEEFVIVQNVESKECYWKNTKHTFCDEIIII